MSARAWGLGALLACGVAPALQGQKPATKTAAPPIDALEAQARTDSNDAMSQYELAMGYWRLKRWDDADRVLRQAVALAPEYAEAYLALSALPFARGEKYWKQVEKQGGKDAVAAALLTGERYYRRAFLLNPMVDLGILGHVDETSYVRTGSFTLRIWWLGPLSKGINQLTDGNYERAHGLFASLVADKRAGERGANLPDRVLWYHGLAAAHLDRYDEAIEDFAILTGRAVAEAQTQSVGAVPLRANDYRYALATMLYLAGRYTEAAPTFRRALEFDIALYTAHVQLARIAEAQKNWDEAVRERQAAIDANPDDPGLVTDLGVTLFRSGKLEEAAVALTQAMSAAPRDPRVPYLAGIVYLRLGRQEAGREALRRFVGLAPSRFAAQVAEAREQLEALERAP